jgi:hypothetical protein
MIREFRKRYQAENQIPGCIPIKVLQIFIRLVKSGWIVGAAELKQIFEFTNVT